MIRPLFAIALLVAAHTAMSAEGPQVFAIRNARIVPVSGPPIDKGTVVLRDGLIEAVGANVNPPPDAWVIEGEGLTVLSGTHRLSQYVGHSRANPGHRDHYHSCGGRCADNARARDQRP